MNGDARMKGIVYTIFCKIGIALIGRSSCILKVSLINALEGRTQ